MQVAIATVSGSKRRWPQSSWRISAPLQPAIGLATKLPIKTSMNCWKNSTEHSLVWHRVASTKNCSTSSPVSKRWAQRTNAVHSPTDSTARQLLDQHLAMVWLAPERSLFLPSHRMPVCEVGSVGGKYDRLVKNDQCSVAIIVLHAPPVSDVFMIVNSKLNYMFQMFNIRHDKCD